MATFSPSSFSVPAETFTSKGGYIKLTILSATDSDQATNKVTIAWKLTVEGTPYVNLSAYYATLGGVTIVPKWTGTKSNWHAGDILASGSTTFDRNPDGTLSLSVYLKQLFYYGYSDARWEMTSRYQDKSGTLSLSQLYRVSQMSMSATSITTNSAVTLNTNRYSSSFTHTFTYSFEGETGTIATNVGSSTTWTPPRSLLNKIPTKVSGSGTIYCNTYSGGTYIGVSSKTFTLTADSSVVPTITNSSLSDGNTQVSALGFDLFLKGKSFIVVGITGSGTYNSRIVSYKAIVNNETYTADSVSNLNNTLKNVELLTGNNTLYLSVIDSRGRESSSVSKTYIVEDYSQPAITIADAYRCDEDGEPLDTGEYICCNFAGYISSIDSNNKLTVKIGYKLKTSSTYIYQTLLDGESSTSFDYTGINAVILDAQISPNYSYDVQLYVSDLLGNNYRVKEIGTGFELIHFNSSGKSMAFGKRSEASATDTALEIALDTDFTGSLTHNGHPIGGGGGAEIPIQDDPPTNPSEGSLWIDSDDMLPISSNIESGSNANGSWIKFPEGTMICYKRITGTYPCREADGAIYKTDDIDLGDYPQTFIDIPILNISIGKQNGSWCWVASVNGTIRYPQTKAKPGLAILCRPDPATLTTTIYITAIGRWK